MAAVTVEEVTEQAQKNKPVTLKDLDISPGKRARLHRLLYHYGVGNGTMLVLPIDQGMEHGPIDFLPNPPSENPEFQLELAKEGGYSAIAFQYGPSYKYMRDYAGDVPLICKLNGRTNVPPEDEAFSPVIASVEEAVRVGADAVGYTCYVGSASQDRDFIQFQKVRQDAERLGIPVIIWGYPRGKHIEEKGGRDSLYAVDYAARVACELGADVVKLNVPNFETDRASQYPKKYQELNLDTLKMMEKVVKSAGRTLVLVSGGSKMGDEDLLAKVELCLDAGVTGLIFGRNMWQRPMESALEITGKIREIMAKYPR